MFIFKNSNQIILVTVILTVVTCFFIAAFATFILQRKKQLRSERDAFVLIISASWDSVIWFICLPWLFFKGLFFSTDSSGKRSQFSMTRTVFALGSFIMLFRLFLGGKSVEDLKWGPQVVESKAIIIHNETSPANKKQLKKQRAQQKRVKRRSRRSRTSTPEKTRPYFYIKKFQAETVALYEILLFLIIAGLYYFRRDLNRGDQGGFLDKAVQLFAEAYALKISGRRHESRQDEQMTTITEENLPPPPPPMEK